MFKKQIIVLLLTVFFSLHGMAQQPLPDSLQKAIDTTKSKAGLVKAYREAGEFYYGWYNTEGYNKAAGLFEKARVIANETGDSILIGRAYLSLAQVYDAFGEDKLPKALEYYTIHHYTAIVENDTPIIMRTYINMASVQGRMSMVDACKKSLEQLTLLAQKYNRIKNLNRSYAFAAYLSSQLNDLGLCHKYFNNINTAKDTITNGSLPYRKFYFLTQFYLLGKENKFNEALAAGEAALKEVNNISDSSQIYNLLGTYARNTGNYKKAAFYREGEMFLYRRMVNAKSFGDASNTLLQSELKLKEENAQLLAQKHQTQRRLNGWLITGLLVIGGGLLYIFYLATQRRKQNAALTKQVAENKLLLQEVHHRVKNNLQLISSFTVLQEMKKETGKAEMIKDLKSKIQALALLHQKLHQQNSYSKLELQTYFEQLVSATLSIHADTHGEIKYNIDMGSAFLDLDTLTQLALITNELMVNSIKYVATKQPCQIDIKAKVENAKLIFTYADNGTGLPANINFDTATTTGLRMIKKLAEQIKATVVMNSGSNCLSYVFEIPLKN
jgi:two-component sensor histidine kinase